VHLATRGVRQPAQQLGERGLARPRLAHDGHRCAGRQQHVDVAQHRRAVAVGEAHPGDGHLERPVRQGHAGVGLGQVDRRSQHAEHLAPTGDGDLRLIDDLRQLGDRVEQQADEEEEGDDLAHAEAPAGPVGHARGGHAGQRHRAEQVAQREHQREVAGGGDVGAVLPVDRGPQA
jgi:hypothetical protein